MQRIELKLIFYPEENEWRIYSGINYRIVKADMTNLVRILTDMLDSVGKDIVCLSSAIYDANKPTEEK